MISPDIVFLALAGIATLGFVLDALFSRLRIASMLPLMLLGLLLLESGEIPHGTILVLNTFIPYVSALTVAFILFAVGLEIRYSELFHVFARATTYTLVVQTATGIVISLLAFFFIHWGLLISFVFGFALSGPSSIAVPVIVRVAKLPSSLRTSLLYESVISDVLQLLIPLVMIGFLISGSVTPTLVVSRLLWTVLGSAVGGIAAAIAWIWILDRLRAFAEGYTWTLTITMVLATYGAADWLGLSPAISIFVFGLTLGNAALLDYAHIGGSPGAPSRLSDAANRLRFHLGLSTRGLNVPHILQVQKEVSFFASSFFFVYIGLLFQTEAVTGLLVSVAIGATVLMLVARYSAAPILAPYLDSDPAARRSQRGLLAFNISRGLAAAVVATVPQGVGLVIPGFLDTIFLAILFSTIVSTVGIFVLYRPAGEAPEPVPPGADLSFPVLPELVEPAQPSPRNAEPATPDDRSAPPPLPTIRRSPHPAQPADPRGR